AGRAVPRHRPAGISTTRRGHCTRKEHHLNAKEFRERIDAALDGVSGDTTPVRKLIFDLNHQAAQARQRFAEVEAELASLKASVVAGHARIQALQVEVESLRQRATQAVGLRAALEGEVARLTDQIGRQNAPPAISQAVALRGLAECLRRFGTTALEA